MTERAQSAIRSRDPVPEPLRSPKGHRLEMDGEVLVCPEMGRVGQRNGLVWSFMEAPDAFYEGKFNNRVRFVPRSDSWLHTLPLRVVMQNYPTTVAAEIPSGASVVEIGCAGGLTWFGRRFRMIGMDLSHEALCVAAEDYDLALQCDATCMPLADGSVDAVISSCFYEHLTDDQKAALLQEAFRVLKPSGKVVFLYDLLTENPVIANYRRADPYRYQRTFLENDGHLGYRTIDANRAFFQAAGLKITREVYHERTPLLSNSVWQKFADWPGWRGILGRIGVVLTSGPLRLPMQALLVANDSTIGRVFPVRFSRGMITVAMKP